MSLPARSPAALLLLGLAACAQPAPPPVQTAVIDPYANATGGALYQGDLAGGTLGTQATAEYFNGTVGNTVLFAADQATLTAEARAILTRQAEWLKTHTTFNAVVQGHAEETGTREYNLALGERRANAAKNYLVSLGVDPGRITTVSHGKEKPLALGSDEASWAQNRRAVTVTVD